MKEFQSRMVILSDAGSSILRPLDQLGLRLSERDLETQIVEHPDHLGEELLVLGSQLAEFVEDRDRLDVLGLDRDGSSCITDLQALAYAAANSSAPTRYLAPTLRKSLAAATADTDVQIDAASVAIPGLVKVPS